MEDAEYNQLIGNKKIGSGGKDHGKTEAVEAPPQVAAAEPAGNSRNKNKCAGNKVPQDIDYRAGKKRDRDVKYKAQVIGGMV